MAPRLAVRAVAGLTPLDRMAQRPLCCVVGRLNALGTHERPQGRLDPQHLPTRSRRLGAGAHAAGLQLRPDPRPQLRDIPPKAGATQRAVPDAIPPGEQVLGTAEQLLTDGAARVRPVHHRLEIANQMCPADLSLPERQPEIALVAIRGDDL